MKGLQGQMQYTQLQQEVIGRLAEIEQEDAGRCASCGGEDCVCCEYWHDRQAWQGPEELFADDYDNYDRTPDYDFQCENCGNGCSEICDDCECCSNCCECK